MPENIKTYSSVIAAKYLLATAYNKGIVLNVTKVQKMLFILYGFFLAEYDHVVLDEAPKAWPYGPVFPRTRKKVNYSKVIQLNDPELSELNADDDMREAFNVLVDTYAKYSASTLSDWSHSPGSPWDKTVKREGFNWNDRIEDDYIRDYFRTGAHGSIG